MKPDINFASREPPGHLSMFTEASAGEICSVEQSHIIYATSLFIQSLP